MTTGEKLIENTIANFLAGDSESVSFKVDCVGIYDQSRNVFRTKKLNRGAFFFQGISDICVLHRRFGFVGIEVKYKKNKQTENQIDFEAYVKHAGGKYFVIRSVPEFEALWKELNYLHPKTN